MSKEIREAVRNYKTKNERGFLIEEVEDIAKQFPKLNREKFDSALTGITCSGDEQGNTLIYHCDVETALRCGVENRDMTEAEFD